MEDFRRDSKEDRQAFHRFPKVHAQSAASSRFLRCLPRSVLSCRPSLFLFKPTLRSIGGGSTTDNRFAFIDLPQSVRQTVAVFVVKSAGRKAQIPPQRDYA